MAACESNEPTNTGSDSTDTTTNAGDDDNDFVENQTWNSTVSVVWNGSSATVSGATDGLTITNENGYVSIASATKHIEYALSGTGQGQLTIYSDYKFKLSLNSLTLACSDGPAINNQCHKTCYVVLSGSNSLNDGSDYASSDEDRKAAFFSEGQLIVSGTGSLSVTGNYKHAICSDDYVRVRDGVLNLTANGSDGIHANDGIIVNGGTTTITAANDGMQCDTSSIVVTGGTINVTSAGDKGLLAYGNIEVSGGTISVRSIGKGIKAKGNLVVSDGVISITASSSTTSYAPAAGPSGGGPGGGGPGGNGGNQPGGNDSSSGPEGIEAKGTITITGGQVYACAQDDAINAGGDCTISGGYVCAYSTGNDGLDANGNCYIKGGIVYAIGSSSPEVGIDANTEGGYKLYVSGGTLVAIGGLESGSSLTQTCYSASSWSKSTWYALYSGNDVAFAFKTPAAGGTTLVVSTGGTTSLKSAVTPAGTAIFSGMGYMDATADGGTTVTLSSYSGSSGGGPGGGGRW